MFGRFRMTLRLAALGTAFAALPAPAVAEDFIVSVPVRIENMPSVRSVGVLCISLNAPGNNIGQNVPVDLPVVGGTLTQTVEVRFNASAGESASSATRIRCNLQISAVDSAGRTFGAGANQIAPAYQRATGQALVQNTYIVEVPIR